MDSKRKSSLSGWERLQFAGIGPMVLAVLPSVSHAAARYAIACYIAAALWYVASVFLIVLGAALRGAAEQAKTDGTRSASRNDAH